ncbi:MAG: cobalamin-independent methionine synthase II family protein [Candidatus Limnocylindrales bacterium]
MKRSVERILTTHTGSLPRPASLLEAMYAREDGQAQDQDLEAGIRDAVGAVVRRQVEVGVDVLNDGEMSKIGYSTYVKDRLTGFEGESGMINLAEIADFPGWGQRMFAETGQGMRYVRSPACVGPIAIKDRTQVARDIANLKAATAGLAAEDVFMTAASPGVIALFFADRHYGNRDAYLAAIGDAMREEYEAIARAGFVLQLDCPDLAMGRHLQFADQTLDEFRREASRNVEALNAATAGIPPEQLRMHLCWGNYEGPHHLDVPLKDIIDIVLSARPSAISLEACNPRHAHEWRLFEDQQLPDDKVLIPGVIDSTTNYIEHPEVVAQRLVNYARLVGQERVMAGSDCGFGTFAGVSAVDPAITWAKLQSMTEGARLATEALRTPTH